VCNSGVTLLAWTLGIGGGEGTAVAIELL